MPNNYKEIAKITDEESGAVIVITVRIKDTGYHAISWALLRQFSRGSGEPLDQTSFLGDRDFGAARRLMDQAERRIDEYKDALYRARSAQT